MNLSIDDGSTSSDGTSIGSERQFFDAEASELTPADLAIPTPSDVDRYRTNRRGSAGAAKDALFARLMPLEGKSVLDYGCGHGENSCLLAACGAKVTAFDLSPVSIEQAKERARLHGLRDRIEFHVREAGKTGYPSDTFDVVTGFAILHHLHTFLPAVYEEIHRVLKPGGIAAFIEPVANSALLFKIRQKLPVPCYATPDERQLTQEDFAPLNDYFSTVEMNYYDCLGRLSRFLGPVKVLYRFDNWLARRMPSMCRFYGRTVVIARK